MQLRFIDKKNEYFCKKFIKTQVVIKYLALLYKNSVIQIIIFAIFWHNTRILFCRIMIIFILW